MDIGKSAGLFFNLFFMQGINRMKNETYVHRSLIQGFFSACINLKIIAGFEFDESIQESNRSEWCPIDEWIKFQDILINKYKD